MFLVDGPIPQLSEVRLDELLGLGADCLAIYLNNQHSWRKLSTRETPVHAQNEDHKPGAAVAQQPQPPPQQGLLFCQEFAVMQCAHAVGWQLLAAEPQLRSLFSFCAGSSLALQSSVWSSPHDGDDNRPNCTKGVSSAEHAF
ncbi:hypothetical protein CLAIMM_13455, partial [Cladophialophora immunda]